jgi:hypothetical protein
MAIAARVVSDAAVAAILATFDMPAERGRAALLDCRHDLELTQAHVPGIGAAPVGSMAVKDVCDLQPRAAHGRPASPRVAASPRSMVRAGRAGWLRHGSWYWRHGCKAPSCQAWRGPEAFESREYRHLVRGGGWRSCAAYADIGITAIIPSARLFRVRLWKAQRSKRFIGCRPRRYRHYQRLLRKVMT